MENYLATLKSKGYRITKPRKTILTILTEKPKSVAELASCLSKKGIKVDRATLYRTLECLNKLGIVGRTQFNGKTSKYELMARPHHHHLVCTKCGAVKDIPLDDSVFINNITKSSDFKIVSHCLEFFGYCRKCVSL